MHYWISDPLSYKLSAKLPLMHETPAPYQLQLFIRFCFFKALISNQFVFITWYYYNRRIVLSCTEYVQADRDVNQQFSLLFVSLPIGIPITCRFVRSVGPNENFLETAQVLSNLHKAWRLLRNDRNEKDTNIDECILCTTHRFHWWAWWKRKTTFRYL